jgi:Single-strand binding protein family
MVGRIGWPDAALADHIGELARTAPTQRDQAEHATQSLSRGSRVVVMGRLQPWSWTAEDDSARSAVEVAEPALGDRHPGPGHQEGQRLHRVGGPVRGA